MNRRTFKKTPRVRTLALAVLACGTAPSFADTVTVNLAAVPAQWTAPDGVVVPMWDFVADSSGACPDVGDPVANWDPVDPPMRAVAGDTLTVNLRNCLAERVSFFVPGLRPTSSPATVGRFTGEVAESGGFGTYTFAARPGTFLYHSATDQIRTQVPMGLYGALVVKQAAGMAYSDVPYFEDRVLVFSAIDPELNADPTNYGGARVSRFDDGDPKNGFNVTESGWNPKYFLINGQAYSAAAVPIAFGTGDNVVLRLVNAGLDTVVPTLDGGLYVNLVAEDGNRYPHPMAQYGVELPAGKTIDAVVQVSKVGKYALYDRALHLTNGMDTGGGMLTYLDVAAGAGLFELGAATYSVPENGGILTVTVNRVGGSAGAVSVDCATANNGTATAGSDYTAEPVPSTLVFAEGETSKTCGVAILDDAAPVYEGDKTFTVSLSNATNGAKLGTPSNATVTITDNDPAPGVLQLGAATYSVPENGGILTVTVNRVGGSAGAVSVDCATANNGTATAGSDYTAEPVPSTLVFAEGETSKTCGVAILDDAAAPVYEGDETFTVSLSNATNATNDATLGAPSSATVTITENDAAPNAAPTANDDVASAPRNTGVTFSVVANDSDSDGTIAVNTVDLGPTLANRQTTVTTTRGGTATVDDTGSVTYVVPKRNFRGTDTFTYTVNDDDGATSNVATVRVNVN